MKTMKKAIAMFLALTCVAAGTVCADGTAQSSAEEAVNAASAAERYDKIVIDICNSNFEEYDPSYADEENYITVQDVELAKKYLEDSSYNGETLKMMVINSEATLNAAQILQIFWNAIGINTEFLIYDNATVKEYKDVNDMWDLCLEYRTGSNYVCAGLKNCFDRAAKHTAMWVDDDDRLYEVFSTVLAAATHSPETWRALLLRGLFRPIPITGNPPHKYSRFSDCPLPCCHDTVMLSIRSFPEPPRLHRQPSPGGMP